MNLTPKQALAVLENIKDAAPERITAACNTIAASAPIWAEQSLSRDAKLFGELRETKKLLAMMFKFIRGEIKLEDIQAQTVEAPEESQQAAPDAPSVPNVDPSTLKGEELEAYMNAATAGMPVAPGAPAPVDFPPPPVDVEVEAPVAAPVVPPSANGPARKAPKADAAPAKA